MRSLFTGLIAILFSLNLLGQSISEITPAIKIRMKQDIEKAIPALKQQLEKENTGAAIIAFSIDTFRIERYFEKYIQLDYTDHGMRDISYEVAGLYDSLLNKYYKKLLAVLKGDDKKILSQAQKSWLSFRDNETKLVEMISKDDYSGGGTMQQLTESSRYLELIKNRALDIFNHYARATKAY